MDLALLEIPLVAVSVTPSGVANNDLHPPARSLRTNNEIFPPFALTTKSTTPSPCDKRVGSDSRQTE